jgi:hypothetical protein
MKSERERERAGFVVAVPKIERQPNLRTTVPALTPTDSRCLAA